MPRCAHAGTDRAGAAISRSGSTNIEGSNSPALWLLSTSARRAPPTCSSRAVCERRIAGRDQARQIQVGPDLVREMHARSLALSLAWHVEIDNEAGVGEAEVVRALRPYL